MSPPESGGLYGENGDTITRHNTIIANNAGGNCAGGYTGAGSNNLASDNSCSSGFTEQTDPRLGPLADNGGPTQTHNLLIGSAAIDAGNDTICNAIPISGLDQRGESRMDGVHCDIGAYEGVVDDGGFFTISVPGKGTIMFGL